MRPPADGPTVAAGAVSVVGVNALAVAEEVNAVVIVVVRVDAAIDGLISNDRARC